MFAAARMPLPLMPSLRHAAAVIFVLLMLFAVGFHDIFSRCACLHLLSRRIDAT